MYKETIKDELMRILNEFFREERGNRITSNNMEGLSAKVGHTLEHNKVEEKKGKPEKE